MLWIAVAVENILGGSKQAIRWLSNPKSVYIIWFKSFPEQMTKLVIGSIFN